MNVTAGIQEIEPRARRVADTPPANARSYCTLCDAAFGSAEFRGFRHADFSA